MAKIKDLFNLEKGTLQSSKCTPGKFDFITASKDWKTHNEFTHECEALIFAAAASGSLGRTHYVNGKFITSDLCIILTPKDELKYPVDIKFYNIIFNTLKDDIVKNTKAGTSKEAIGLRALGDYDLPYIDYKQQKQVAKRFNNATDLSDNLNSEFLSQLSLIKDLRQAFLREAMQGKLVNNDTSDGKTGTDLLQEIQVEKEKLIKEKKIKKGKLQEAEVLNNLMFKIPQNWVWAKLDDLSLYITDGTHQTPTYTNTGRIFLSAQNVKPFKFLPEIHRFVSESDYQGYIRNRVAEKGDLLVARVGAGIGETAVIDRDIEFAFYVSLGLIKPFTNYVNSYYLEFVLNSPYGVKYSKGNISSKGGSAGNFNLGRIRSFLVPLPPIEVQNRIVSKLNEMMAYCDDMEKSVRESQNYNEQLLQQVLREALEGKNEVENENLKLVAEEYPIYSIQNTINKNCDTGDMAILAGYIIKKLSTQNSKDFGRVKLQKMLHLVEYHCQLSSELKYQKNVAGPHAWELEHVIEPKLKSLRFFEIKKDKFGATSKVTYTPLSASNELSSLFNREFKDQAESINDLLDKFQSKTWEFCEMISTMYSVWNNRLIRKELFTDEILKQDFLAWDDKKKRFIDQLDYALDWIRKEKIEPVGFGEYIDKN